MAVYRIVNDVTKHVYIGSTSGSIQARFKQHCQESSRDSTTKLHTFMKDIGIDHFSVELIEETTEANRLLCEDYWMTFYHNRLGDELMLNTAKHAYFPMPQKSTWGDGRVSGVVKSNATKNGISPYARFYHNDIELIGYAELIAYLQKYGVHVGYHALRHYVTGLRGSNGKLIAQKYPVIKDILYCAPGSAERIALLPYLRKKEDKHE